MPKTRTTNKNSKLPAKSSKKTNSEFPKNDWIESDERINRTDMIPLRPIGYHSTGVILSPFHPVYPQPKIGLF